VSGADIDPRVRIRAVTFDYGGTLDGEASHWLDRFVDLYREAGLDLPFDRLKEAFYRADDAAYAEPGVREMRLADMMRFHVGVQLEVLGMDDRTLHDTLVDRFVARSREALTRSREVLAWLAPRFRLGVISNFYGNVGHVLAEADIAPFLTTVADSTLVGAMKPDRRIFEHAVGELGTAPGEVLHVGDSYERDVLGARAAGLQAVWLFDPSKRARRGAEPETELGVASLDEFVALLRGKDGGQ
jgi:putative hydrolase of the HAD superfamily